MCKWILSSLLILLAGILGAQNIAINPTGNAPHPSAMLDISSPDKGVLIPRLANHATIAAPATGLLVFNTTTSTFWFYNGTQWIEITFPVAEIRDADGDTWVTVENTPDEDIIRFGAQSATDQMRFDGKTLHWQNSSIYIGEQSGAAGSGANNTYLGYQTGTSVTTGVANTLVGSLAGTALTSADNNVIMGSYAAENLSAGKENVIFGSQAGRNATNTDENVFIGFKSAFNVTTAKFNTFLGFNTGFNVTTGQANTYLGHGAGMRNATGQYNVAIGHYANGESGSSIGKENVFIGVYSGRYTNSNANVMIGHRAGEFNVSNWNNTFVGYRSGQGVSTSANQYPGLNNSFFGFQSGTKCMDCHENTFIGSQAGENISNGSGNTILGRQAGFSITSGSGNILIGYYAGNFLSASASNRLVIANNSSFEDVLIYGDFATNRVGINTVFPDATLTVDGVASKTGSQVWAVYSDRRVKKDIAEFSDGLELVLQLNPITYKYKENSGYSDLTTEYVGFIAQEVEQVAPYMVSLYDDSEGPSGLTDKRVLDEGALTKILVNAIQEQHAHIESLEERIARLEQMILQNNPPVVSEVTAK